MNFADVKALTDSHGEVVRITSSANVLWEAVKNRWNLLERTEFRGESANSSFYFSPVNTSHVMNLSEDVWVNGAQRIDGDVYYWNGNYSNKFCTMSDITENSFTMTTGSDSNLSVAFPFHLNAGETITVIHTRNGPNRSGYQVFNADGSYRSYTRKDLSNSPGAIDVTEFTAPDECWFFWICGRYDANTSVTISNIVVTIQ